jgi:cobalt-zinc-cadmium efflux system membrane fusion protein
MKNINTYKWIVVLLITWSITSCGNSAEESAENENAETETTEPEFKEAMLTANQYEALQMVIDTISMRNMSGYVEANGTLEVPPQNAAILTAITGANVVSIEVIEGDKVKKNQAVAYLSHPSIIQIQSDYLNAYSNSQYLKQEFERQKKLYDAGVASGMNYQKSTADYNASMAMVNGLEAQLRQYNINVNGVRNGTIYQRVALRSPIRGSVEKVMIKIGQYVEPQTNLMEVVDTDHVHAVVMVFERDVDKVRVGQKVKLNIQSKPNEELVAEIYSVGQTFEQDSKTVHIHAEIENKTGDLIPGMYVQGRIEIDNVQTKAMPESAIALDGERSYLFMAVREGDGWSFQPVEIQIGEKDGNWIAIRFMTEPDANTLFAMNNAYYLMAEMKKGSAGHSH